jgi:hypothetical protein
MFRNRHAAQYGYRLLRLTVCGLAIPAIAMDFKISMILEQKSISVGLSTSVKVRDAHPTNMIFMRI